MGIIKRKARTRLPERLNLRLPVALPPVIEDAAAQRFVSVSEYVRLALLAQLTADGVDVRALGSAQAA